MIEETSNSSSSNFSDADEVDQLLESYADKFNKEFSDPQPSTSKKQSDKSSDPIEKIKTVVKTLGKDYFEPLPEGWLKATHYSGMHLYLHRESRVCTWSKPYYLGDGSVRKHDVPVSALPCLEYRREKAKDANKQEAGTVIFESVEEHKREKWLCPDDLKEYCDKLFDFDEVLVRRFKTWSDRRKLVSDEEKQRPTLPDDTKLLTCPSTSKKGFVINPAHKSYVCILHEFVQHRDKVQPKYTFKELENPTLPYEATTLINNIPYGIGFGKSKKDAKEESAKKTIDILIPEYKDNIEPTTSRHGRGDTSDDLKFFETVKIDDERVYDLCTKAGLQSPYQILMEWKNRNAGYCDTEVIQALQPQIKHQRSIYMMKVGEHEVNVICKNSREGKQLASQALLKKLHPNVTSWSSILLMYGRGSFKTPKEKKEEEQKITELQATAKPNEPNWAILNKLKEEMRKLPY